jgi:hypothetical protein
MYALSNNVVCSHNAYYLLGYPNSLAASNNNFLELLSLLT